MNSLKIVFIILLLLTCHSCKKDSHLSPKELLGKKLFFDENLSSPPGQSCATCHDRKGGWAGPDSKINRETGIYPGALKPRFGRRKPPAAAYSGFSPPLHIDKEGNFIGGLFWDGRATGWETGDPLAEQAMAPFLNPLEQNLANKEEVIKRVIASDYADLFEKVWGKGALSLKEIDKTYIFIVRSIASYERSIELNPFNSKFDDFWKKTVKAGLDVEKIDAENQNTFRGLGLGERELKGLVIFNTKGKCSQCHVLTSDGTPPLFTDFTYDNLGVPRNPRNPFYRQDKKINPLGIKWTDPGLGEFLKTVPKFRKYARRNLGKHRVPTLRNVDMKESDRFNKSFMHNGVFTTLKEVLDFYNTRDIAEKNWPKPEVKENVNTDELGNLKLTDAEIDDVLIFLKTLSDG